MKYKDKITKTLGGDRLGSGNKMKVDLHTYNRSTHDLSHAWRSSMNVGTLVPFLKLLAVPGDSFSIDLEALVRTVPSIGALYGSYKMQMDVFACPIRLYNGLLHNNMVNIGLNMSQVILPTMTLKTVMKNPARYNYNINNSQIAPDSLLAYLGLRGVGDAQFATTDSTLTIERKFNAVPVLAYYDIYKNYYANKQEERGFVILPNVNQQKGYIKKLTWTNRTEEETFQNSEASTLPTGVTINGDTYQNTSTATFTLYSDTYYTLETQKGIDETKIEFVIYDSINSQWITRTINQLFGTNWYRVNDTTIYLGKPSRTHQLNGIGYKNFNIVNQEIALAQITLDDIDDARIQILQNTGLNNELSINNLNAPYNIITGSQTNGELNAALNQCGLAIKTYQSDINNNWLNTEWIAGTNGINAITAVDVSSGSFTIDALNLANKVYNMLNRIAVSGGSYEDYIEAVYTTETARRAESPIYLGGMSAEIVFEEVVATAATQDTALGSLAAKGALSNKNGGHIECKITEPSYIIGIASITPRIDYSQGNDFDITELKTIADLHVPALDGIGFEDLLEERAAWWGTYYDPTRGEWKKVAAGKQPAWINYMTATNRCYGDFARDENTMFMTLNRRYEYHDMGSNVQLHGIKDFTSYIDPTKYNYTFADTSLNAQNFWTQIGIRITARRVMSAKVMPTL